MYAVGVTYSRDLLRFVADSALPSRDGNGAVTTTGYYLRSSMPK
jgi:hypothetical protein